MGFRGPQVQILSPRPSFCIQTDRKNGHRTPTRTPTSTARREMTNQRRVIFLPLRTNVRYFASRRGFAALDSRLKALALLYDDLLFENGVYDCSVGEQGAFDSLVPFMNDDQLKPRRSLRGQPMGVNIQN